MTYEEIARVVEAWARAVAARDMTAMEELVAPSLRESVVARTRVIHASFRDVEVLVQHLVIEGDTAAWRWKLSGVHLAPIGGVHASGARKTIEGANFQRMRGGVVVDHWTVVDLAGLR